MNDGPLIELIDHTADVGLDVRAADGPAAYAAVAEGMFDILLDRSRVEPAESWEVQVDGADSGELLVTWLEELLYLYESEGRALRSCTVLDLSSTHLRAEVTGERFDRTKHDPHVQIKAVTYHQLHAEETPDGFHIRVIFDI